MTVDTAPGSRPTRQSSRWRRWRLGRWLTLIIFLAIGHSTWRQYVFRKAMTELNYPGLLWSYDDPVEDIRKDWHAAFQGKTWSNNERCLWINSDKALEFVRERDLISRLRPDFVHLYRCDSLENFQQLRGLDSVRELEVYDCLKLRGLDGISASSLVVIDLASCPALRSLGALKNVPSLKEVTYWYNPHLQPEEIDALKDTLPNTKVAEYHPSLIRSGNVVTLLSPGMPFLRPRPAGVPFLFPQRPNPFPLEQFGENRFPFETVGTIPALNDSSIGLDAPNKIFPRSAADKEADLKDKPLFK